MESNNKSNDEPNTTLNDDPKVCNNKIRRKYVVSWRARWAGNPNITVATKAFGLRATVQVVDLQVFVSPRITLKPLVPRFPCFANIYVSLMEKAAPNYWALGLAQREKTDLSLP
ncbi:hypothetical protein DEO72_LG2g2304 [Vigna unguiculata]|uniref:Uncharacterized protein n=1 Tax=Vigna unguiculata TaxID=3917 RepID=A0A4D6KWT8_VIGUN|nr:hypothetical protein DEO72_LG2g2304 [Vigna unguiculata]